MLNILQIPAPVKSFFDKFPIETYGPVEKRDDALAHEINSRIYNFEGSNALQKSANDTFKLGVYRVMQDSRSGRFLASDPWCLYAQLSLCKKSGLKLSSKCKVQEIKDSNPNSKHSVYEISSLAANERVLPVLIEGSSKRHVRSAAGIYEILNSRLTTAEELMYSLLLDSVVYDCYTSKVLYQLNFSEFLNLYGDRSSTAVDRLVCHTLREDLSKRNNFALRHRELVARGRYSQLFKRSDNMLQLIARVEENCRQTLTQFQALLGTTTGFYQDNSEPSYLDLKLASYIYCLLTLPESASMAEFLRQECSVLVVHSQKVISYYQ
ncbi:LANO_0B05358g1_1 [Lachancea nothofagi CBS 11611]|uniref:LANO_0B05358g1_1 n=1 Tax=Lachancea nothofagi CBS 11611 TaxID=1266666 RepID=A0A1G4IYL0_9SACH|nr:LANO_0B05358g1_1 [Lachancea nothofagi CBS 11611]